ncbi:MAG: ribonuclease HII [Proteobacteria bacterium]|nr:ribonuclease HII [Pseudomonadota bacterium]
MPCSLVHEQRLSSLGLTPIAGIDEAGRGPLAGPVVVGGVILPPDFVLHGLNDSKKLTPKARERLYAEITGNSEIRWTSIAIPPQEIDRLNILGATHSGMRAVIEQLSPRPAHALIDGLPVPNFPCPQTALVGGDGLSLSIAAASIIAKVERDLIMLENDRLYPEYGFAKHKGYPTAEHFAKLRSHGPCPIHRRSFAPVAQAELW